MAYHGQGYWSRIRAGRTQRYTKRACDYIAVQQKLSRKAVSIHQYRFLTDGETHDRGLAVAQRYGFSLYDSMIVAAALLADCKTLFSEDLHDGQQIDGLLVVRNLFRVV